MPIKNLILIRYSLMQKPMVRVSAKSWNGIRLKEYRIQKHARDMEKEYN